MPEYLTPTACRRHGGNTVQPPLKSVCRSSTIPPDPHAAARLESMRSHGRTLNGIVNLAKSLRGKTVYFGGDSVTEQVTNALLCAAQREELPIEHVRRTLRAPDAMSRTCEQLMIAPGLSNCACETTAFLAHGDSMCRVWGGWRARGGQFQVSGWRVAGEYNMTILPRTGIPYHSVA